MRREVAEERKKTVAAVRALLTEAQRAKVAALEQALRDYDTACAAAGWSLLEAPQTVVRATKEDWFARTVGSACGGGVGGVVGGRRVQVLELWKGLRTRRAPKARPCWRSSVSSQRHPERRAAATMRASQ